VPILRGRLVVELQGETIDAAAARMLAPDVLGGSIATFLADVVDRGPPGVTLPEVRAYPERQLDEDRLDQDLLNVLRKAFADGETVAARLPVTVFPKAGGEEQGHVDLYLRRAPDASRPFALRLRGDITVPKGGGLSADRIHSALIAGDGAVSAFLGDAEPPAHDTWTATSTLKATGVTRSRPRS
jgi:hypothetical protein